MRTPTVNRDLPWEAIRREWETSLIDMVALARKYGVASTTTLTRRRDSEGWKRNVAVVEARQALADVISDAMAIDGTAEAATGKPIASALWQPGEDRPLDKGKFPSAPVPPRDGAAMPENTAASELDAEMLLAPRHLGHAIATSRQRGVALALVLQRVGLLMLNRVEGVLQPPGENAEGEALVLGDLQRLIRVNPERETLSGLVATAGKALELGATLERRAIAADATNKPASGIPGIPIELGSNMAREILQRMDPDAVERVHAWALEMQRKQREAQVADSETK
jgi:hypothetical protein